MSILSQPTISLQKIKSDEKWSFKELSRKDTRYITHGYHRYPAKFIPQLAAKLISGYSAENDLIVDPFLGSGTTLVEAKVLKRRSFGCDINPVACLISRAKTESIEPDILKNETENFIKRIELRIEKNDIKLVRVEHPKIDRWFDEKTKIELEIVLNEINRINNEKIKTFILCCFSHILKNVSRWNMKSNKPVIDKNKKSTDLIWILKRHMNYMIKSNNQYFEELVTGIDSEIMCQDARKITLDDNSATLMVTSPPYVTSYEYADLHQLTVLWLSYAKDLNEFSKKFIGTNKSKDEKINMNSEIAEYIVERISKNNMKKAVSNYFSQMNQVFQESYRYLKDNGKMCMVIGNTKLLDVEIKNTEVFLEQASKTGFKYEKIIKREIPFKTLPQIRDEKTGRFTNNSNNNKTLAYPTEYILIMKK